MADQFIQVPPDSTGKKLDTEELTVSAQTVQRERMRIAGLAATDLAPVTAADGLLVNLGTNNDVTLATLPSLVAGTANIGDVDVLTLPPLVAGTANIGDVDVLTVIPGTAATNLGKAIDSAAGATDTGVAVLAIRDDALATLTPVDGDYVPLRTNDRGALWIKSDGTVTVTDDASFDVASIVAALPAGTNRIGAVSQDIDRPAQNTTALTLVRVAIDVAASGDNTIIAAQGAGNKIRVIAIVLVVAAAVVVTFKSATTLISGDMSFAANGGFSVASEYGVLQGAANEAFIINLSGAIAASGFILYTVVT